MSFKNLFFFFSFYAIVMANRILNPIFKYDLQDEANKADKSSNIQINSEKRPKKEEQMVVQVYKAQDYSQKEGIQSIIKSNQDFLQIIENEKNIFRADLNSETINPKSKLNSSSRMIKNKRILNELTDQIDNSTQQSLDSGIAIQNNIENSGLLQRINNDLILGDNSRDSQNKVEQLNNLQKNIRQYLKLTQSKKQLPVSASQQRKPKDILDRIKLQTNQKPDITLRIQSKPTERVSFASIPTEKIEKQPVNQQQVLKQIDHLDKAFPEKTQLKRLKQNIIREKSIVQTQKLGEPIILGPVDPNVQKLINQSIKITEVKLQEQKIQSNRPQTLNAQKKIRKQGLPLIQSDISQIDFVELQKILEQKQKQIDDRQKQLQKQKKQLLEFKSLINDSKSSALNGNISLAKLLKDKINERSTRVISVETIGLILNKNEKVNNQSINQKPQDIITNKNQSQNQSTIIKNILNIPPINLQSKSQATKVTQFTTSSIKNVTIPQEKVEIIININKTNLSENIPTPINSSTIPQTHVKAHPSIVQNQTIQNKFKKVLDKYWEVASNLDQDYLHGFNIVAALECIIKQNKYEKVGKSGYYRCVKVYKDGMIPCFSSRDCEGDCILKSASDMQAVCQADDNPFGCWTTIQYYEIDSKIVCMD